jgi:hypothetical protein
MEATEAVEAVSGILELISPTIYVQLFHAKVSREAYLYSGLHFFGAKISAQKLQVISW